MKRTLFAILIITCLCALADVPTKFYLWAGGEYTECSVEEDCVEFSGDIITAKGKEYQRTAVDSITFAEPVVASEEEETTEEDDTSNTVYVTYAGSTASVECDIEGVTYTVDGADVTLTNTITDTEITVELTGQSSSGSLVYTASYKTTVRLNGLTLTGSSAEAINVKCGKRIALVLADGTTNTLADCAEDGGQKAAFYTKGHLEVSGGGTLNVVGNVKHGLCSKEYMLVKKTVGTINITSAAKDGIHAGEYVQINGGTLSVSGVGDDGIQAELADDGEEDDGCIIVKGGEVSVKTTGNGAKALKADTDINIKGGTLNVTQTGGYDVDDDGSASYTTALKAEGDINITGGTISITTSGTAAKGLSADGNVSISEDDATTSIVINNTGAGELFDGTASGSSTGSYKVYVSLPTSSSGGGGNSSSYWTNVYLYNSSGTKVATLTNTVTLSYTSSSMWGGSSTTSKTFYYYDFGAADSGTYYFGSDDYTSSSGGGFGGGNSSTTYTIKSSTFTGPTSGSDVYYTMSSGTKSGSTYTFSLTDATSTWASATTSSTTSSETVTATGIKSDGNTAITAGTVSITMTGAGGKGI